MQKENKKKNGLTIAPSAISEIINSMKNVDQLYHPQLNDDGAK